MMMMTVHGSIVGRTFASLSAFPGVFRLPTERGRRRTVEAARAGAVFACRAVDNRNAHGRLQNFKEHEVSDQRAERRFIPVKPYSQMMLADGRTETCLVIDVSISGAAISAETVPEIGTVLAVGTIVGRVVRHFEGGFAVQFVERQSRDELEEKLLVR